VVVVGSSGIVCVCGCECYWLFIFLQQREGKGKGREATEWGRGMDTCRRLQCSMAPPM
jgi:hypothetical protein